MTEREAMERALGLALEGWGRVAPNPLVGAVLLRNGEVVGEGAHREFGGPHAEVVALESCPDPAGSTCVVNLEPCAHHGKTPPCSVALASAGVTRVVYGVRDPHPEAGGGADALMRSGVDVTGGLLRERGSALNAPFLWNQARPDRPFVALKLATSVDGFVADESGTARWISSQEAREHVHWLRAGFDAIGVGRRTAEADDPQLAVRGSVAPRVPPTRVVFSRTGSLDSSLSLVTTASDIPTLLVVNRSAGKAVPLSGTAVRVVHAQGTASALLELRRLGIGALLVEGGGLLAGSLLEEDLVDRLYWYQAPLVLGRGVPAFPPGRATLLREAVRWIPIEQKSLGDSNLLVLDRGPCSPES
jgi:diaminohydroxyphosphoribosylaminopyrimidine deaminase/5-amino-6-(5-phosphoribosylamino)uracil reductase